MTAVLNVPTEINVLPDPVKLAEQACVQRITPIMRSVGVRVENSPETGSPESAGKVLIFYDSGSMDEPDLMQQDEQTFQRSELRFRCNLRTISLRDHSVVYPIKNLLRSALLGFQALPASQHDEGIVYLISDEFVAQENGIWLYSLVFGCVHYFSQFVSGG